MLISFQSPNGHTILTGLSDAQVDAKFDELTHQGFTAFADTRLADPVGPVRSTAEARDLHAEELYFVAPLQGG